MSIFDKFKSVTPRSSYIGAPLNEMAQAMAARTKRADDFYTREDALEDAFANDKFLSADEAMFNEKQAAIRTELEELAKNPHQSSRRIKSLARQYAGNESLQEARTNYKNYMDWQTKFKEDPTKYGGDVAAGLGARALAGYGGVAAGDKLKMNALYEYKDINKTLQEAAKTIKASKNFEVTSDGRFMNTVTKKYITAQEAEAVLMGSLMNDPTIMKQIGDYSKMYGVDPNDYARQLIAPQVEAITHAEYDLKLNAIPKRDGDGRDPSGLWGSGPTHAGPTVQDQTHGQFRGLGVMETINALGQGDSPANARHESEIIEHYNKLLNSEASSVQDKHLSVYLNEKGVEAINEFNSGSMSNYERWHIEKYGEVADTKTSLTRKLRDTNWVNSWFGENYGGSFGDSFADAYSTANNTVFEDAGTAIKDLGYKSEDVNRFRKNIFPQMMGQGVMEVLGADGKVTNLGSEDMQEMFASGELIGVSNNSDFGEFKVQLVDGSEQIMYIRLPKDRFSLTSERFNKRMKEGYGDGSNVNYQQLGQSAMGLNRDLTSQVTTATSRLYNGDNDVSFNLSTFSNLDGEASVRRDANGNATVFVNGKDMLKGKDAERAALTAAINTQNAEVLAGIMAGIGVKLSN